MDEDNRKTKRQKFTVTPKTDNNEAYRQTEDAVLKTVMQYFKDELLPYWGFKEKAVGIAPTELVHLELQKLFQDFNLVMEDGSWSHFEFQSKNEGLEGLKRFRVYEAMTSYQHKVKITTYVLFSGTIQNPMTEFTEGLNTYRIQPIIMTKYIVEELMNQLQKKVDARDKLTKEDLVPLTMCSLMGGEMYQKERIKKAFEFSKQAESDIPKHEIEKIESVVYAMAEKFLEKTEIEEIREAIKMTTIGQMLREDGRAEGRAEGRGEGMILGTIKTCMDFQIPIEQIIEKLMENFSLTRENAEKYMEEFNSQKTIER